ncbi:hypothetical protein JXM83_01565 [Candidatus Woesearchaeota archaeon]|nr:hypothetical protein [Candidatus Woesearchaeota archaeon]
MNKKLNDFIKDFNVDFELEVEEQNKFLVIPQTGINDKDVFFSGTSIAILDKKLIPTTKLLEMIKEKTKSYVRLNEKGAWLFICGRDVLEQGVIQKGEFAKKILVLNEKNEILGVAESPRKDMLANYWNIGDYLKREK